MSATSLTRQVMVKRPRRASRAASAAAAALAMLLIAIAAGFPALLRPMVAIPMMGLMLAACLLSPRRALIGLLVWLAVLGSLRRLLLLAGASGEHDPLLLVAPAVVALLTVVAIRRGAFRARTPLTTGVLVLSGLAVAGALNPLQGSIAVGLGGLLFVLVPMLWFWIGRGLVDDELLDRVLLVVGIIAIGAAGYGLFQVYQGLPAWDDRWVRTRGYVALQVGGGSIRPFASFSSSAEYVGLLSIGIIVWALRLRGGSRLLPACVLVLLGWALTLASVRGALVAVPVAIGVTFAAAAGFGPLRTLAAGMAALILIGLVVSTVDPDRVGGERTSALLSRQVTGLSDPLDPEKSTLPVHLDAFSRGLREGVQNPIGRGLGTVTIAADRFGSGTQTTETDPSNVAVALGLPGLLAYFFVAALGLATAFRRARDGRDLRALAALAVPVVMLLQWLNGGAYAVAPLPWLLLGWLDRPPPAPALGDVPEPDLATSMGRA